jgi:WD40-like Beta Propeller Repeat
MPGVPWTIARTLILAALAACGFRAGEGTAGVDGAVAPSIDAAPDALVLGAWSAPVLVAELSSGSYDDDPTLTADQLEVYFATTRAGDEDIWRATRASAAVTFGQPAPVTELNSFSIDSNVEVSGDGLVITFTSSRGGGYDLWYSTRAARGTPWATPRLAAGLNSTGGEWGVVLSPDLLTAVLCSDRGGDEALFLASRGTASEVFTTLTEITGIETVGDECDGALPDAQTLYFTRNAAHTNPDLDLYVAHWNGTTYGDAEPLAPLNTGTTRDSDPWVSPDQRTIYFSSNRLGGAGFDDIYMATR